MTIQRGPRVLTGSGAAANAFQPIRAMATAVLVAYSLIVLIEIGAAFSTWTSERFCAAAAAAGDVADQERAESLDARAAMFDMLHFVGLLLGAATLLPWFYRAVANARRSRHSRSIDSPGWAIGAFFMPVMNIWKPGTLMADLASVSRQLAADDGGPRATSPGSGAVWLWWGSYLGMSVFNGVSGVKGASAETYAAIAASMRWNLYGDLAACASAGALIFLTLRITDLQERARLGVDVEATFG